MTRRELLYWTRKYMNDLDPSKVQAFFDKRANGRYVMERKLLE